MCSQLWIWWLLNILLKLAKFYFVWSTLPAKDRKHAKAWENKKEQWISESVRVSKRQKHITQSLSLAGSNYPAKPDSSCHSVRARWENTSGVDSGKVCLSAVTRHCFHCKSSYCWNAALLDYWNVFLSYLNFYKPSPYLRAWQLLLNTFSHWHLKQNVYNISWYKYV